MEEKMKKMSLNSQAIAKEPTKEELKAQLMQAQQANAALRMEAQKKIESMNYVNAFEQQKFMLEIIKLKDSIPQDIVNKAINAIDNFWFEEMEDSNEQGKSE